MLTKDLVAESNRIEGILRPPTDEEVSEHRRFVFLDRVKIADLVRFVNVYQPNAKLRDVKGLDVRVGSHVAPPGGQSVLLLLDQLIRDIEDRATDAYDAHLRYETLHPFTDGNGRSGRVLWYWMMRGSPRAESLGFLHCFYYQTLERLPPTVDAQ